MRQWIQTLAVRSRALVALSALAILTVVALLVAGPVTSNVGAATSATGPTDAATAEPSAPATTRPTPTPTPIPTEAAQAEPAEPAQPDAPAAAAPAPAPVLLDPGIIAMEPGPGENCGEFPSGQTIYRSFSWSAREGNTVDVYYAYTDGDVQATSGFVLIGAGLATSGTVTLSRVCPNGEGTTKMITVKLVAMNANGSSTAYYWGV